MSLREAITDAFRAIAWEESGAGETEEGEEGLGLQLLGGWVYKVQLPQSLSPREWNHLYDLVSRPALASAPLGAQDADLRWTIRRIERLSWLCCALLRSISRSGDHPTLDRVPCRSSGLVHRFDNEEREFNSRIGFRDCASIATLRIMGRRQRVGLEPNHACTRYRPVC